MAKFHFTATLDTDEDFEIPDDELEGKSEEEREDIIAQYYQDWVVHDASGSIDGGWEEIDD